MTGLPKQVSEFLSNHNIGVAGVSRDPMQAANTVYRKLRASGYRVFAINRGAVEARICSNLLRCDREARED